MTRSHHPQTILPEQLSDSPPAVTSAKYPRRMGVNRDTEAEEAFDQELARLREAAKKSVHSYEGKNFQDPRHTYVLFLARAVQASEAMHLLYTSGFLLDAGSLQRTLCELYIDVRYIRLDDAHLERFVDYAPVLNERQAQTLALIRPNADQYWIGLFERLGPVLSHEITTWQELRSRHQVDLAAAQEKHNYSSFSWARHNTKTKAKKVDAAMRDTPAYRDAVLTYELAFRPGCLSVHPSLSSLHRFIRLKEDGNAALDCDPEPGGASLLIFTSLFFFMKLYAEVNDVLKLGADADDAIRQADKLILSHLRPGQ